MNQHDDTSPQPRRGPAIWPDPLHEGLPPDLIEELIETHRAAGWDEWAIGVRFGRPLPEQDQT